MGSTNQGEGGGRGRRLIVPTIDLIAASDPDRPWISVPKDDDDLSRGFVDLTYAQLANAVNHAAAWLHCTLGPSPSPPSSSDGIFSSHHKPPSSFETIAYTGLNDHRAAVLACAAAKTGRTLLLLLPFPLAPLATKLDLLDATRCSTFLYPAALAPAVADLLLDRPDVRRVPVPELEAWMTPLRAPEYLYKRSWAEAKDDPWLVFHSAGTTGAPKPVVYTQQMMASVDLADELRAAEEQGPLTIDLCRGARFHSPLPLGHLAGMVPALATCTLLGAVLVRGPGSRPPTAEATDEVLRYGNVRGLACAPFTIRELCRRKMQEEEDEDDDDKGGALARLRALDFVIWTGAPLDAQTGEMLKGHTQLVPSLGSTECGPYLSHYCVEPEDWPYYWFAEGAQGIELQALSSDALASPGIDGGAGAGGGGDTLYELVFRKSADAVWQQVFLARPELDVYRTKDVFRRHASKAHLWAYVGRVDDVIKLSSGFAVHVTPMEETVARCPGVGGVLVDGAGRERLFALVEVEAEAGFGLGRDEQAARSSNDLLAVDVWAYVEAANHELPRFAHVAREMVVLADPQRPFPRSAKGSVLRRETLALYGAEIASLYTRVDGEL